MKDVIGYFVSVFLRQLKVYVKFYSRIYKNIWNLPREYDLADKTLLIRTIKHTITTVFIFSILVSLIDFVTEDSFIGIFSNTSEWGNILWICLFVVQSSLPLYLTNKIYPRNRLIFRECLLLSFLFFLILFPFCVLLLVSVPFGFELVFALYLVITVPMALITFWNEKILLNLSVARTIFFQFVLSFLFGLLPSALIMLAVLPLI